MLTPNFTTNMSNDDETGLYIISATKWHRFPMSMKGKWLKALGEDPNKKISGFCVVCSVHFKNDDYEQRGSARRLKKHAIPSLHVAQCSKQLVFNEPSTSTSHVSPVDVIEQNTRKRKYSKHEESGSSTDGSLASISVLENVTTYKLAETFHTYSKDATVNEVKKKVIDSDTFSDSSDSSKKRVFLRPLPIRNTLFDSSSNSPQKRRLSTPVPNIISPTKSISSSVERRRKVFETFHNYSHSPNYAHKQLQILKYKNKFVKMKLKSAAKKNKLLKRKVNSLHDISNNLKKRKALSDSGFNSLEQTFSGIPLELMKRLIMSTKNGKKSRAKYPPELRSFAMTLQFYSPKAYEYVRRTFNHALPHQAVIRSWYSKVDYKPGFSAPAFSELKSKVSEEEEPINLV